jgi:hypothetical protein
VAGERIDQDGGSTYELRLLGEVSEDDVNRMSPCEVSLVRRDETTTTFRAATDQAGMLGLMRYLHGMGFVILSVYSQR